MGRFTTIHLADAALRLERTWKGRLALAALTTGAALLVTLILWPSGQPLLLMFAAAVVITALIAGFTAGLAAAVLSLLCIVFFLFVPAASSPWKNAHDLARVGAFAVVALLLAWIIGQTGTMRRQLAAELGKTKRLAAAYSELASIVESSNDAIFSKALDGTITSWNRAAEEMYGYTAAEAIGRNIAMLIPAELAQQERQILGLIAAGKKTPRYDTARLRKDGSLVRVSLVVSPVRDENGEVIGASSIAHDVTQEKQREQALRHREAELRTLLEAVPQIVWSSKADGTAQFFNRRWFEYTGMSEEEALGWGWQPAVHPDDLAECLQRWRHSVHTGTTFEMQYRLRRSDGTYRWHLGRAVAMRGPDGSVVEWFGACTDIHDYKQAQVMLVASEKAAAMGRMAGSIAHEINNPLAAISNLVVLLSKSTQNDFDSKYYLNMLSDEVARVVHITRQTLGFYQESHAPVRVNLCHAVNDVLSAHAKEIQAHEIRIEKAFGAVTLVEAFPADIRHLLSNLVLNAIEALDHGGMIRIEVGESDEAPDKVQIVIADNGPGISAAIADRVFEPFFSTKGEKGTGLGLWVSEGIAKRHGGELRFSSSTEAENHGTTFTVILPKVAKGPMEKDKRKKKSGSGDWRATA